MICSSSSKEINPISTKGFLLIQPPGPGRVDGKACHINFSLTPQFKTVHISFLVLWPAGKLRQLQAYFIIFGQEDVEFAPKFDVLDAKDFIDDVATLLLKFNFL